MVGHGPEAEALLGGDDDGAGDGGELAGLPALAEVGDELLDLPADHRALVGVRGLADPPLEDLPVHPRPGDPALGLVLGEPAVAQDLELDEPVDLAGREGGLVEFDAELLDAVGGDADHRRARL